MTNSGPSFRQQDWLWPTWLKDTDVAALAHVGHGADPGQLAASAVTTVFDFEDLGAQGGAGSVPRDYSRNLTWSGLNFYTQTYLEQNQPGTDNGIYRGVTSGETDAVSGGTSVTIASDGANFDLTSLALTSAFRDRLIVKIEGYDDGEQIYSRSFRVGDNHPTDLTLDYVGIDRVVLTSYGGTPAHHTGKNFVLDDVAISSSPGSVSGVVFDDLNANGVQDQGEAGLRRSVFLDANGNGLLDEGELSARTRADGSYTITGVPFGIYDIVATVPGGWHATAPFVADPNYSAASAPYKFIEIASTGEAQVFNQQFTGVSHAEAPRGFTFYGQTYTDFTITTNGYIAFGPQPEYAEYYNVPMPKTSFPNAIVAPFWDDLYKGGDGKGEVYVLDDAANGRTIIEWKNYDAGDDDFPAKVTFEVILGDDGSIRFMYKDMSAKVSPTVGVENQDGTLATQISYNTPVESHTGYVLKYSAGGYGTTTITVDSGAALTGVDFGQVKNVASAAFGADRDAMHHGVEHLLMDHGIAASAHFATQLV